MKTTIDRSAALVGVLTLAAVATAATATGHHGVQEKEAEVTVQLSPKNDSGVSGTARIYESGGMHEHEGMEADEEAAKQDEPHEHGEIHGHRVVVELSGLEAGAAYPVHVHQGTCADGGGVVLPLASVRGGEDGSGSSATEVSPKQMKKMMEELMGGREHGAMKDSAHGEDDVEKRHGEVTERRAERKHPPAYVQAHLPDGTPAACGDVPMEDDDEDER